MKKLTLKYVLGYILFLLLVFLISNSKVLALDYVQDINVGGKSVGANFWIGANSNISGTFSYHGVVQDTFDYLVIQYCATGKVTNWGNGTSVPNDGIHIKTDNYCGTQNYGGVIQYSYYSISNWYYSDNSSEKYIESTNSSSFTWSNRESYAVEVRLLSVTTSSSLDVSIAILAYLQSNGGKDYNSVLNEIKANQENYKQELNTVNDSIQQGNQNLTDIKEELTNDSVEDSTSKANDFFSGFTTDTFGLTSIITAPLTLIGSITSSSCSPLGLKVPFLDNKTLNLPCMSSLYQQYFGPFLTIYQTITFGLIAYWVCVRIFALVKDFKNPDEDKVEVLDL